MLFLSDGNCLMVKASKTIQTSSNQQWDYSKSVQINIMSDHLTWIKKKMNSENVDKSF